MRMMRPISKSYLVGRDDNGEYAESSAIHTVAKHGLVEKAELDLSNYNDVYPAFKSVADMQRLTGIFASAIKVLAYIGRSGVNESTRKKILDLDEAIRGMASNVKKLSQAVKDEDKIKFNDLIIEQRKEIISLKDQVKADLKAEERKCIKLIILYLHLLKI
jgi:hypothetical protein